MDPESHENKLIAERLQRLEKEIRWIRRFGVSVAVALAVFILLFRFEDYRSVNGVSAKEFVLTDSLGRTRAKLAFFPGGPGLEIYAASGESKSLAVAMKPYSTSTFR